MGGRRTLGSEIFFGRDQSAPEIMQPDPVDGDAWGEWIGGVDDPPCQSAARWSVLGRRLARCDLGDATGGRCPGLRVGLSEAPTGGTG
mgnify:CR=1 FL=1